MFSITKMRGCFAAAGPPALIVIAVALIVGLLNVRACGGTKTEENPDTVPLGEVLFTVNDVPVYSGEIVFEKREAQKNAVPSADVYSDLAKEFQPVENAVMRAARIAFGKWQGVEADEKDLADFLSEQANKYLDAAAKQLSDQRNFMILQTQASLDAVKKSKGENSKEFKDTQARLAQLKGMSDEQFAQSQGFSLAQLREQTEKNVEQIRTDPTFRRLNLWRLYEARTMKKYEAEVKVTDNMAKESYDRITYEEIKFHSANDPNYMARAEDVLKKVQSGMDFHQAILQYSDSKPANPKAPNAFSTTAERLNLIVSEDGAQIALLKPNRISGVIKAPDGAKIVKVTKIEIATPSNFDAVKAERIEQIKSTIANGRYQKALEDFSSKLKFEWNSDAPKLLHAYADLAAGKRAAELNGEKNRAKLIAAWRDLLSQVQNSSDLDSTVSAMLQYAAFESIEKNTLPGPDQEKLKSEKLEIYKRIEGDIPYAEFHIEYAKMLIAAKEGKQGLDQLYQCASNLYESSPTEEKRAQQIEQIFAEAKKQFPAETELIGKVQSELDRWHKEDQEAKKQAEEEKKQQAADAAEIQRQKEALKAKQQAKQPPAGQGTKKGG